MFYYSTLINRCRSRPSRSNPTHRPNPLAQTLLLITLITTLAACAPAPTQPGGLDPLGTAAVTEAQARAARQQLERIAKATQEAQATLTSATETARQNEIATTRTANEAAQQAQATRQASEIRATDQAIAAEANATATAQHLQVARAAQEAQATQTAVAVESAAAAYNQRLAAEANATATAIVQHQRAEAQQMEAEQTRQRNEALWQVLLISVGAILGTVVLVFVILSVRPAVVKMWDAFMKSRETMARIRAAAQHPAHIVNEPRVRWPATNMPVPSTRSVSHRHRFGNEDILAKWDAKRMYDTCDTRHEGDLESTRSMVIEQD